MNTPEFAKIIAHRGHLTDSLKNAVSSSKKVLKFTPEETEKVWMQQGSQSKVAEEYCAENGIDCISNECILMFLLNQPDLFTVYTGGYGVLRVNCCYDLTKRIVLN